MRILWLCNIAIPDIARSIGLPVSNKEGWISGLCAKLSERSDIELAVCFPAPKPYDGKIFHENGVTFYCFYENTSKPEKYDKNLTERLSKIYLDFKPELVHVFGTEYQHTYSMLQCVKENKGKSLVGIQGVMSIYADHYYDGVPQYVVRRKTFRDILKKDGILQQQKKYRLRAVNETNAMQLADNVTGRTLFDKEYCEKMAPKAKYHFMNETLRMNFYVGKRNPDKIEIHSIFLSQGNYPIKGLHYVLEALPLLHRKYPDAKIYVAGDSIFSTKTIKDKLKISSYGKYITELISKNNLGDYVFALGSLDAERMKERLLVSDLFLCPSTIENSPNSLGEAMLLGVPCVSANVGGISSIFEDKRDGLLYSPGNISEMVTAIDKMWSDKSFANSCVENAEHHARKTHDAEQNYNRLIDIYTTIINS